MRAVNSEASQAAVLNWQTLCLRFAQQFNALHCRRPTDVSGSAHVIKHPLSAALLPFLCLQTNCLEELTRPAPDHSGVTGRSDWVHLFHSVLPALPLHGVDEGRVASALRSACAALVAKHNTMFRAAGVAVWEMRFRVPGGAWRLLVSCPTGEDRPLQLALLCSLVRSAALLCYAVCTDIHWLA
jgi:hypothetical protein